MYWFIALTIIPTILPKVAPMAIEGTKMPAGTLHPYEITTRPMRIIVARSRELDIRHWSGVLRNVWRSWDWCETRKMLSEKKTYWHKLKAFPPPSHSLKRMAILEVISIRRNRLKYPITAVRVASVTASATPWFVRYFRRKAATCRLNLIIKAP